jgi:hypothetical protein
MKSVAAGAIGLAISAILVITFVKHEVMDSTALPTVTMGYWQGKYDPVKPLPGTTNVPANSFNNSIPNIQTLRADGPAGRSDRDDDMDE